MASENQNYEQWRHFLSSLKKSTKSVMPEKQKVPLASVLLGDIDCFSTNLSRKLLENSGQSIETELSPSSLKKLKSSGLKYDVRSGSEKAKKRYASNNTEIPLFSEHLPMDKAEAKSLTKSEERPQNASCTENVSDVSNSNSPAHVLLEQTPRLSESALLEASRSGMKVPEEEKCDRELSEKQLKVTQDVTYPSSGLASFGQGPGEETATSSDIDYNVKNRSEEAKKRATTPSHITPINKRHASNGSENQMLSRILRMDKSEAKSLTESEEKPQDASCTGNVSDVSNSNSPAHVLLEQTPRLSESALLEASRSGMKVPEEEKCDRELSEKQLKVTQDVTYPSSGLASFGQGPGEETATSSDIDYNVKNRSEEAKKRATTPSHITPINKRHASNDSENQMMFSKILQMDKSEAKSLTESEEKPQDASCTKNVSDVSNSISSADVLREQTPRLSESALLEASRSSMKVPEEENCDRELSEKQLKVTQDVTYPSSGLVSFGQGPGEETATSSDIDYNVKNRSEEAKKRATTPSHITPINKRHASNDSENQMMFSKILRMDKSEAKSLTESEEKPQDASCTKNVSDVSNSISSADVLREQTPRLSESALLEASRSSMKVPEEENCDRELSEKQLKVTQDVTYPSSGLVSFGQGPGEETATSSDIDYNVKNRSEEAKKRATTPSHITPINKRHASNDSENQMMFSKILRMDNSEANSLTESEEKPQDASCTENVSDVSNSISSADVLREQTPRLSESALLEASRLGMKVPEEEKCDRELSEKQLKVTQDVTYPSSGLVSFGQGPGEETATSSDSDYNEKNRSEEAKKRATTPSNSKPVNKRHASNDSENQMMFSKILRMDKSEAKSLTESEEKPQDASCTKNVSDVSNAISSADVLREQTPRLSESALLEASRSSMKVPEEENCDRELSEKQLKVTQDVTYPSSGLVSFGQGPGEETATSSDSDYNEKSKSQEASDSDSISCKLGANEKATKAEGRLGKKKDSGVGPGENTKVPISLPAASIPYIHENIGTDRKRQRNKNTNKRKSDVDIPCSKWSLKQLSEYVDFKQSVDKIEQTKGFGSSSNVIDIIEKRLLNQIETMQRVIFTRNKSSQGQRQPKTGSGDIYDLSDIKGTEQDVRILLDAILIAFAEEMELNIVTETSYENNNLPNCKFDYQIHYKDDVVGLVQIKSRLHGNGLGPESAVQGILQLAALQAEVYGRRTRTLPTNQQLAPLPFINIISDGYQFIFIQLDHDKLRFDQQPGKNGPTIRCHVMDSREGFRNVIEQMATHLFKSIHCLDKPEEEGR